MIWNIFFAKRGRTGITHVPSNADLIEAYNKENTKPKLRQKVKNEIVRRNKIGLANIVFN